MIGKHKNGMIILVGACAMFVSVAQADVAEVYQSVRKQVDELEKQIAGEIENGIREGFLGHFATPPGVFENRIKWFDDVQKYGKSDKFVGVNVDLPLLGASSSTALVHNGLMVVQFASGGKGRLPLPPLLLEKQNDKWVFTTNSFQPVPAFKEAKIKWASFAVRPLVEEQALVSQATLTLENGNSDAISKIPLYFRYALNLKKAMINGKPIKGEMIPCVLGKRAAAYLQVTPERPLKPGETVRLSFDYTASYKFHDLGRKPVGFTDDRGFVLWETGWYPRARQDWNMIPYEMAITVDPKYVAMTSGELIDYAVGSREHTYTYRTTQGAPPYFLWGIYQETVKQAGEVKMVIMTPPEGVDPNPMMKVAVEALNGLGKLLPDPVTKEMRIVAVTRYGGYGPPGYLLLQDSYFAEENACKASNLDFVAHEMSHGWVNAISDPTGKPQSFLSEGLATYLGAKAVEIARGKDEALGIWRENHARFEPTSYRAVVPMKLTESVQNEDNVMFRAVAYKKGAYMFRELERIIGESRLLQGLKNVILKNKNRSFTLDDFINSINEVAGRDLEDFWNAFLRGGVAPDFVVTGKAERLDKVTLVNHGSASFTPVDLVAYDADMKEVERISVTMGNTKEKDITFGSGKRIARIVVDPDKRVLQTESRNDIYPDYIPSSSDATTMYGLIGKLLQAFQDGDVEAFSEILTTNNELLAAEMRKRVLEWLAAKMPMNVKRDGDVRMFALDEGRFDTITPILAELPGGNRLGNLEFNIVKEESGWKVAGIRFHWN